MSKEPTEIDFNTHLEWMLHILHSRCRLQPRHQTWQLSGDPFSSGLHKFKTGVVVVGASPAANCFRAHKRGAVQKNCSVCGCVCVCVGGWVREIERERERESEREIVFICVFQQSQLVLTGAEDLLIPATAPSSQSVIWRSCSPPVAHIDFWLCAFYVPAEFSTVSEETPPPHQPLCFLCKWNIDERPWPPFFIYSYTRSLSCSLSLSLSLSLAVLPLFSRPLYLVFHHFLHSCASGAIFKQMLEKRTMHLCAHMCVWVCISVFKEQANQRSWTQSLQETSFFISQHCHAYLKLIIINTAYTPWHQLALHNTFPSRGIN